MTKDPVSWSLDLPKLIKANKSTELIMNINYSPSRPATFAKLVDQKSIEVDDISSGSFKPGLYILELIAGKSKFLLALMFEAFEDKYIYAELG